MEVLVLAWGRRREVLVFERVRRWGLGVGEW